MEILVFLYFLVVLFYDAYETGDGKQGECIHLERKWPNMQFLFRYDNHLLI